MLWITPTDKISVAGISESAITALSKGPVTGPVMRQPHKQQFYEEDAIQLKCRICKITYYWSIDKRRDNGICSYCGTKIIWPRLTIVRTKRKQIAGLLI